MYAALDDRRNGGGTGGGVGIYFNSHHGSGAGSDNDENEEKKTCSSPMNAAVVASNHRSSSLSILPGTSNHNSLKNDNNSSLSEPLTAATSTATLENVERGLFSALQRKTHQQFQKQASQSSTSDDDPFYVFRDDLYRQLELVDESLAEYLRIVHQTDTAVNVIELKDAKKQLKRHIKTAESTLADVQMTVQVVEKDRHKFAGMISDQELYERQSLCLVSRDRLHRAKEEIQSESVKAKMHADERAKAIRRAVAASSSNGISSNGIAAAAVGSSSSNNSTNDSGNFLGARNQAERDNSDFIVDSQARTSLLFQEQEDTLEDLDAAVVRVGHMATTIHEEIGQQNKMLTEMEEDLATAEQELGLVMGKLAKFLKTKDKWQLCTVLGLSLTAVVLFLLILYT